MATSAPIRPSAAPSPPPFGSGAPPMQDDIERRVRIRRNLGQIRHKVLIMSGKGGVGKSTVTVNLAASLAQRGFRVGVLDMDLTGPDVPLMLGLEGEKLRDQAGLIRPFATPELGIKVVSISFLLPDQDVPVAWRGPMKSQALSSFLGDVDWGELDFLLIDLPPGTSDEPLSVSQAIPDLSGVVIVTTPQGVSTLDVSKSIRFAKLLKLRVLGVLENMSGFACPNCGAQHALFGSGGGQRLADEALVSFLGAVPFDPTLVTSGDAGRPFIRHQPGSPAAQSFEACVDRFLHALSEPSRRAAAP